jgi:type II secretory pathway pseudopilin PulG
MCKTMLRKGFTKFELAMGLALLAIVALVLLPPLRSGVEEDQAIRAWSRAESIAYAILDYHDETGRWPATAGSALDLSCLTEAVPGAAAPPAMALMGAHGLNGLPGVEEEPEPPVLEDVPLDAWDRPFTVLVLDIPGSDDRALIVLSAGADGVLETDPAIWPLACLTAPEPRSAVNPDTPQEKFTVGDDLACLMKLTADGGM